MNALLIWPLWLISTLMILERRVFKPVTCCEGFFSREKTCWDDPVKRWIAFSGQQAKQHWEKINLQREQEKKNDGGATSVFPFQPLSCDNLF